MNKFKICKTSRSCHNKKYKSNINEVFLNDKDIEKINLDEILNYLNIVFLNKKSKIGFNNLINYIKSLKYKIKTLKKEVNKTDDVIKILDFQKILREKQILKYIDIIKKNNNSDNNNNHHYYNKIYKKKTNILRKKKINMISISNINVIPNKNSFNNINIDYKSSNYNKTYLDNIDTNFNKNKYKINNISKLLIIDTEEAKINLENSMSLKYLKYICRDNLNFKNIINKDNPTSIYELCDSIKHLLDEYFTMFKITIKLKEIFDFYDKIINIRDIDESLFKVINITTQILECERASIFIYDYHQDILWSKISLNTGRIIISKNKGIVGKCFNNKKIINIKNVNNEKDFDPSNDKKTGFETKTILCFPLFNKNMEVIGVIQAINKNKYDFFNIIDEGLIKILSNLMSSILNNCYVQNDKFISYNKLWKLVLLAVNFNSSKTLMDFISIVEKEIFFYLNCEKMRLYYFDKEFDNYYFYKKKKLYKIHTKDGLVREIINNKIIKKILNPLNNKNYNSEYDINTSLGIVICPLFNTENKLLGFFEFSSVSNNYFRTNVLQEDLLNLICILIGNSLNNYLI